MKNMTKLFALAVVILGFSATSFGQENLVVSGTATQTATATITAAATFSSSTALNFGSIIPDPAAISTVSLGVDGNRTRTGNAVLIGTSTAGEFVVAGTANAGYVITLPSGVSLTGVGEDMSVSDWVCTVDDIAKTSGAAGTIGASPAIVKLGAKLNLGVAQAVGIYSGVYALTMVND